MKIVINTCYGGFSLSDMAIKALGLETPFYYSDISRTDERLIALVEQNYETVSGFYSHLEVVEIPDEATDWMIDEYDGAEDIIYVVDGKIHRT